MKNFLFLIKKNNNKLFFLRVPPTPRKNGSPWILNKTIPKSRGISEPPHILAKTEHVFQRLPWLYSRALKHLRVEVMSPFLKGSHIESRIYYGGITRRLEWLAVDLH